MAPSSGLHGRDLFARLNVDEVNELDKISHMLEFEAGKKVFEYNQPCTHIYMLMEGQVYLMLPSDSASFSFPIAEVTKHELFGLSALLKQPRYTAEAKCNSKCTVMAIETKLFMNLLESNRHISLSVMNEVAQIYYFRYLDVLKKLQNIITQVSEVK